MIPYVTDQLAMARMRRATYALLVALLPATATVIGVIVLVQIPTLAELAGVGLVIVAVALHRDAEVTLRPGSPSRQRRIQSVEKRDLRRP